MPAVSPLEVIAFDPLVSSMCEDAYSLYQGSFHAIKPHKFIDKIADKQGYIARQLGETIGMAFVALDPENCRSDKAACLELFAIAEPFRRNRLGSYFLEQVERAIAETGKHSITLLASGPDSLKFYLANGFETVPDAAYVMNKQLHSTTEYS